MAEMLPLLSGHVWKKNTAISMLPSSGCPHCGRRIFEGILTETYETAHGDRDRSTTVTCIEYNQLHKFDFFECKFCGQMWRIGLEDVVKYQDIWQRRVQWTCMGRVNAPEFDPLRVVAKHYQGAA